MPPWWPRPRVGTSDCRFRPMGGGRSPPLRARGALREWGIPAPLRDIIDSEWWRCSTVRKVHRRARAARAVRTLGNVRALHRTEKERTRPGGIRVSASDGDEPQREDDMPLGLPCPPTLLNYLSLSLSPPSSFLCCVSRLIEIDDLES